MTAQERPSLGQPPHLTLPHTQCSHRNTYKDLERRPARGPRGKKSLGRRGGGRRGACPDPKLLQDKTSQPPAGQAECGRGTVPTRPPSCPSRVAYNKVQICPADPAVHSSTPFSHVRTHSRPPRDARPGTPCRRIWQRSLRVRPSTCRRRILTRSPPSPAFKTPQTHNKQTKYHKGRDWATPPLWRSCVIS